MKKINSYQYESIAKANLKRFIDVSITNKYAKDKKYKIIETERINSLGFTVTDYNIFEL